MVELISLTFDPKVVRGNTLKTQPNIVRHSVLINVHELTELIVY